MSFSNKHLKFGKVCHFSQTCAIPTLPNLAITPSKMAELVDQGIPVSTSMLSGASDDGVSNPSWDMPIDERRGVDVATVWESQRTARKNITRNVVSKD